MVAEFCSGDGIVAEIVGLVCFLDAGRSAERSADGVVVPKRSMVTVGWTASPGTPGLRGNDVAGMQVQFEGWWRQTEKGTYAV